MLHCKRVMLGLLTHLSTLILTLFIHHYTSSTIVVLKLLQQILKLSDIVMHNVSEFPSNNLQCLVENVCNPAEFIFHIL